MLLDEAFELEGDTGTEFDVNALLRMDSGSWPYSSMRSHQTKREKVRTFPRWLAVILFTYSSRISALRR
ncbi:hypothetical protein LTSEUGA_1406, partial [Salmonella enterica subsp. enterica serovar Uganda str. R8-3404]